MEWHIYILKCADGSFYTGIAKNIQRRIDQHNTSNSVGAKYTRTRRPVELVYSEEFTTRSDALKRENEIKKLTREYKEALITGRVAQR